MLFDILRSNWMIRWSMQDAKNCPTMEFPAHRLYILHASWCWTHLMFFSDILTNGDYTRTCKKYVFVNPPTLNFPFLELVGQLDFFTLNFSIFRNFTQNDRFWNFLIFYSEVFHSISMIKWETFKSVNWAMTSVIFIIFVL